MSRHCFSFNLVFIRFLVLCQKSPVKPTKANRCSFSDQRGTWFLSTQYQIKRYFSKFCQCFSLSFFFSQIMSMENFEKKLESNTLALKFHGLLLSLAHLVDIRMTSNSCSSCRTHSGDNINHSIGKSSLFKGQEISIANFGIFKSPQKRTKYFKAFCPSLLSL